MRRDSQRRYNRRFFAGWRGGKKLINHLRARLDFPGVSCEACREAQQMDGVTPDCKSGQGCLIPDLPPEGKRVLEIRGLLQNLKDVVDPGTICRICDVDLIDLQLLAAVEAEIKEGMNHGEGS